MFGAFMFGEAEYGQLELIAVIHVPGFGSGYTTTTDVSEGVVAVTTAAGGRTVARATARASLVGRAAAAGRVVTRTGGKGSTRPSGSPK